MSVTSFTSKQLRFTLVLNPENANSIFPMTNNNTLVISDCRATATVQTVPGAPTNALVKIFGMDQKDMFALSVIFFGATQNLKYNSLLIEQNSGSGWTQVFSGMITDAQPRFRAVPNAYFEIVALIGYQHQISPVPALSYRGTVPVETIAFQIAQNMGYAFDNSAGVTANVTNCMLPGTNMDQLNRLCLMTRTQYVLVQNGLNDDGTPSGTLYIYPFGGFVPSIPMLQLSPQSGLEGYPELEKFGLSITSLYNPALAAGGRVQVTGSIVPPANGIWSPNLVTHVLESNMPGGRWHTTSLCYPVSS